MIMTNFEFVAGSDFYPAILPKTVRPAVLEFKDHVSSINKVIL